MLVFLSYRRSDSVGHTGRIFDALEAVFGSESVFKDMETISAGEDFVSAVRKAIAEAEVNLVVIGPRWTEPRADGPGRLFDGEDNVRLEVREALAGGKLVIPVLVGGADFPAKKELPEDLHPMLTLNAMELSDQRWDTDMERLVAAITGQPSGPAVKRLLRGKRPPVDLLPFVAWMILVGLLVADSTDAVANGIAGGVASLFCLASLWRVHRRKARGSIFAWIGLVACAVLAAALLAPLINS